MFCFLNPFLEFFAFRFGGDDFPTVRTAFIVQPLHTAEILTAYPVDDTHKHIAAVPALDFPHQHLVIQVVFLAGLYIQPLIQITHVHSRKVGGVIDNDCPMAFEKLVHI